MAIHDTKRCKLLKTLPHQNVEDTVFILGLNFYIHPAVKMRKSVL